MMIKQLKKDIGKVFRLYPTPVSRTRTPWPERIPEDFNTWRLEIVDEKRREMIFSHPLGYRFPLGFDHLHDRMSPDILKLWSQTIIRDPQFYWVPLWPQP